VAPAADYRFLDIMSGHPRQVVEGGTELEGERGKSGGKRRGILFIQIYTNRKIFESMSKVEIFMLPVGLTNNYKRSILRFTQIKKREK
jgi:hypothetical protein